MQQGTAVGGGTTPALVAELPLAQRFDECRGTFDEAVRAAGGVEHTYSIAGFPVRLRFAGSGLVSVMTPAFAHLSIEQGVTPALTVCLWDTATTGKHLPPIPWAAQERARGPLRGDAAPRRFRAAFQPVENAVSVLDAEADLAFYWTQDARTLPFYESSSPLRFILDWWMARRSLQLVHGGAVGTVGGGALLIGKGGSGKSTAALACLESGLSYAGDDHVLITADPSPHAYSLYCSGKLHADHIRRFPHLLPMVSNADRLAAEKAVIFVHQHRPGKTTRGFPLKAVVIPRVGDRRDSGTERVSGARALAVLGPSTIFALPGAGQAAFERMAEVLGRIPSYILRLGSDILGIAPVIERLLSED